jgi:5-methylcytosine-specific restriction endonuclease McrA
MKNVHPLRSERRKVRRLAELGGGNPCCLICGETAIECLEVHEIAGFRRDRETRTILCRNCHRKQTARLLDAGVDMIREENMTERTSQWMRANAVLLHHLAEGWEAQAKMLQESGRKREDRSA